MSGAWQDGTRRRVRLAHEGLVRMQPSVARATRLTDAGRRVVVALDKEVTMVDAHGPDPEDRKEPVETQPGEDTGSGEEPTDGD